MIPQFYDKRVKNNVAKISIFNYPTIKARYFFMMKVPMSWLPGDVQAYETLLDR